MRIKLRISCILICLLLINISFAQKAKSSFPYTRQVQNQLSQKNIEIQQNDIEDLYIERQYFDKKTNVTHVYIGQRFKGIKINNAISSLALRDEKEVYFGNAFITNIASKVNLFTPTIILLPSSMLR